MDRNPDIQRQVQTRESKEVFRQQQRNIRELLDRVENKSDMFCFSGVFSKNIYMILRVLSLYRGCAVKAGCG